MEQDLRKKRLEEAINYLMSIKMVDNRWPSKSIAEKMERGVNGISSAKNGDVRYLTAKFVNAFCAAYGNIISADWIWNGVGTMLTEQTDIKGSSLYEIISDESLSKLSREQLESLVKQLMVLHSEQTEMYRMLIRQNEEMIRNGQERFNNITNLIFKNV